MGRRTAEIRDRHGRLTSRRTPTQRLVGELDHPGAGGIRNDAHALVVAQRVPPERLGGDGHAVAEAQRLAMTREAIVLTRGVRDIGIGGRLEDEVVRVEDDAAVERARALDEASERDVEWNAMQDDAAVVACHGTQVDLIDHRNVDRCPEEPELLGSVLAAVALVAPGRPDRKRTAPPPPEVVGDDGPTTDGARRSTDRTARRTTLSRADPAGATVSRAREALEHAPRRAIFEFAPRRQLGFSALGSVRQTRAWVSRRAARASTRSSRRRRALGASPSPRRSSARSTSKKSSK